MPVHQSHFSSGTVLGGMQSGHDIRRKKQFSVEVLYQKSRLGFLVLDYFVPPAVWPSWFSLLTSDTCPTRADVPTSTAKSPQGIGPRRKTEQLDPGLQ